MGYTHYWHHKASLPARKFKRAAADCRKVYEAILMRGGPEVQWEYDESGPPAFGGSVIRFNGIGEDGHETFLIDREQEGKGGFCKTARKPYDLLVCACLIVLRHHIGEGFWVDSDGDDGEENWPAARGVCQEVLGYGSDFTANEPERLGRGGLKATRMLENKRGHAQYYGLDNGWSMFRHGGPGRGVEVYDVAYFPSPGHEPALTDSSVRGAAWAATKLYLTWLLEREGSLNGPAAAILADARLAVRGDWAPWYVLADYLEEHLGRTTLRKALPKR